MRTAKERRRLTYGEIAAGLGRHYNAATVTNYFTGKAKPPLELLGPLANAVGADPEEALVALGLLSEQFAHAVLEMASLRRRVVELEASLRAAQERSPASSVVDRTLAAGWAIGLWPGSEGSRWGRLSVGHRMSLVPETPRTNELPTALVEALSTYGAVRVRRAVAEADIAHLRPGGTDTYELWSMPTLTAARPSPRHPRIRSPRAVLVFSLTLSAGPNDVGSLLAYALRYGFSSTREARAVLYGGRGSARDLNRERNRAARVVLRDAELREGTVWSHFGAPVVDLATGIESEPFAIAEFLERGVAEGVWCIWLRESEDLLQFHRSRSDSRFSLQQLLQFQDRIERSLGHWSGVYEAMEVDVPTNQGSVRDAMMDRAVEMAAELVGRVGDRYGVDITRAVGGDEALPEPLRRAVGARW